MARCKPYDYKQLMMIPVNLDEQLVPGTLEYAIHPLIEERIDRRFFDERFCNDCSHGREVSILQTDFSTLSLNPKLKERQ